METFWYHLFRIFCRRVCPSQQMLFSDCFPLTALLNDNAPMTQRKVRSHLFSPWYTQKISSAKRKCRQLESRWRKTHSSSERVAFVKRRNLVGRIADRAKSDYFKDVWPSTVLFVVFGFLWTKFSAILRTSPCLLWLCFWLCRRFFRIFLGLKLNTFAMIFLRMYFLLPSFVMNSW